MFLSILAVYVDNMFRANLGKRSYFYLKAAILCFSLLLPNALWLSFPDEGDTFTAGWLISNGNSLYIDIFSHHMPFPYYYAGFLSKLGLGSVAGLRLGMALTLLMFWLLIIRIFGRTIDRNILGIMLVSFALAYPVFWGNLFVAESFSGWAILVIFLYFFSNPRLDFGLSDKMLIALMAYVSVMSSLISIYPILLLGMYYAANRAAIIFRSKGAGKARLMLYSEAKFGMMLVFPFALTLLFFYAKGALNDFFDQAYSFNMLYYSQFYSIPFGGQLGSFSIHDFIYTYSADIYHYLSDPSWFTEAGSFFWQDLWVSPLFFQGFLLLTNLGAMTMMWRKKGPFFAAFYFLLIGALKMRNSGGFHDLPYFIMSFFSLGFLAVEAHSNAEHLLKKATGHLRNAVLFLFALYLIANALFLAVLVSAYFSQGSGLVQNEAHISIYNPVIRALTDPNDTIWVAPSEPALYFTSQRMPSSRYLFYLPWMAASDNINQEILDGLRTKQPPVLILDFERLFWVLRSDMAKELNHSSTEDGNSELVPLYFNIYGKSILGYVQENYSPADPDDDVFDKVYLLNSKRAILLRRLYDAGLYYPEDEMQLSRANYTGEIISGMQVVQTFTPNKELSEIDVYMSTLGRENTGTLIFRIRNEPNGTDLYNETWNISDLYGRGWYEISFGKLNASMAEKTLYLIAEAPDSKPGNAITLYTSNNDSYSGGELYINGTPTGRDLVFVTYWVPEQGASGAGQPALP